MVCMKIRIFRFGSGRYMNSHDRRTRTVEEETSLSGTCMCIFGVAGSKSGLKLKLAAI